jgi:hypothetical protein
MIDVLLRGSALPGFAGSPDRSAATVVDGSWADNVPAAPLLFDRGTAVDLLFVIYLKPRIRHGWRHNSLVGLVSFLIRNAKVFVGDGRIVEPGSVLVRKGKIEAVYEGAGPDPATLKADTRRAWTRHPGTIWFSPAQAAG